MTTAAVKKAAEINQESLETASKLQLDLVKEMIGRMSDLLKQLQSLHSELQADKELLESDIAAREAQIDRMDTQINTQIKLNAEWREFLTRIEAAAEQ